MNQPVSQVSMRLLIGVAGCFLLSGFAALLYQMAWMRQFSTIFGTSETAVATVLSAYMGGLALGAALAGQIGSAHTPTGTILWLARGRQSRYLGIAGAGYCYQPPGCFMPPYSETRRQSQMPRDWGQPLFYFVVAFAVLIVPTACMGATLAGADPLRGVPRR